MKLPGAIVRPSPCKWKANAWYEDGDSASLSSKLNGRIESSAPRDCIAPQALGPFVAFVHPGGIPYEPCPVGHRPCPAGVNRYMCCSIEEDCRPNRATPMNPAGCCVGPLANYMTGFNNIAEYQQLHADCTKFQGNLLPCDSSTWGDYHVQIYRDNNYQWAGDMCCYPF